jgi:hypothetical protein
MIGQTVPQRCVCITVWPIEESLLWLLEMKCSFLSLQVADHFFGSVDRHLIADREQYAAIPLKRLVDLCTLFTHCYRPSQAEAGHLSVIYNGGSDLFHQKSKRLGGGTF